MKFRALCLGISLMVISIRAEQPVAIGADRDAAHRVSGKTVNLRVLFDWQRLPSEQQQAIPRPLPEWNTYDLRVVGQATGGLLVQQVVGEEVAITEVSEAQPVYYLTNLPGFERRTMGEVFRATVRDAGVTMREDAEGSAVIKVLDYGRVLQALPKPPPPHDPEASAIEMRLRKERQLAIESEQAERGIAAFQFRMGKRYLYGEDVTQDLAKARAMFEKAAAQGHADAAARLQALDEASAAREVVPAVPTDVEDPAPSTP